MTDRSTQADSGHALTPHGYLMRIANWVRTHERVPMTWAHVVFISLDTAISHSSYKTEPLLRVVRDALRTRVLDKLRADEPGLDDADLREAVGRLGAYERGRPRLPQLQDRFLRWLSDHPNLSDSTLGDWREILAETGVNAEHFDGGRSWPSSAPSVRSGEMTERHWSEELAALVGLERVRTHVRELQAFLEVERARRGGPSGESGVVAPGLSGKSGHG